MENEMINRIRIMGCILFFLLPLGGCGDGGGDPAPVEIFPQEDVCQTCRMLISDLHFAAECVMDGGKVKKFDDPICMVRYFNMAKTLGLPGRDQVRGWFVKDYNRLEWIDARKAWFVKADVVTVMGYGVVTFGDEAAAQAFAEEYHGTIIRFDELWELFQRPDVESELTLDQGILRPDRVTAHQGDLVEIRLNVADDREYRIGIKGYDNDGLFPKASKGHPAFLRFKAVQSGESFDLVNLESGQVLGVLQVRGHQ